MATKEDYDYHNHTKTRGAYAVEPDVIKDAGKTMAERGDELEIDPKDTQKVLKMLGIIHCVNVRHHRGSNGAMTEIYSRDHGEPYELSGGEW